MFLPVSVLFAASMRVLAVRSVAEDEALADLLGLQAEEFAVVL